ncbi:MAG: efflux RND transporter periplasmic adaptor subunit [Akkermansiaceae bacterium]|nr:efflux RND transporter periplasmic adaptor subunit [Akkermansiaceae bacterium]
MNVILRIAIPLLLVLFGYGVMVMLRETEEKPAFQRPKREPPNVDVIELKRQQFPITLLAQGIVRPRNDTSLTPRVSGRVLKIDEHFEAGAFFKKGEILLELDPADFDAAVASAEAQVARSEASLAQEVARAEQAILDWKDLGYTEPPSDLVMRKPQLKEAEANVKSGEAQLLKAQRDLERAQVLAPYDGCVRTRMIGLGQSVSPGTTLGDIFSTDYAEVRLPLSSQDLSFITLPEDNNGNALEAVLSDALKLGDGPTWPAQIIRSEGVLDETSRELFVTARVTDPYGLTSDHPPLRVGQPVRAKITGNILEGVFIIPRSSLRSPTEVVLVNPEDSTLQRTPITPIWGDKTQVIVRDDLPEGWFLVTSDLRVAANGSTVKPLLPGERKKLEEPEEAPKAARIKG